MLAGPEALPLLEALFERMMRDGTFSQEVYFTGAPAMPIRWHLCSDYALCATLGTYCCVSSRYPCLFCLWTRDSGASAGQPRNFSGAKELTKVAETLAHPLREAVSKV